jgi:hypothetical protein
VIATGALVLVEQWVSHRKIAGKNRRNPLTRGDLPVGQIRRGRNGRFRARASSTGPRVDRPYLMGQHHVAGDKLFVDYSGKRVDIIVDPSTDVVLDVPAL